MKSMAKARKSEVDLVGFDQVTGAERTPTNIFKLFFHLRF